MDRLITRLKSGKVAHWATAYLAAAWVLYQLLEAFGDTNPDWVGALLDAAVQA